ALAAAAVLVAPLADDGQRGAQLVLGLRALGAVVLLVGLALLAQSSLLAKVVATTVAGVLVMASAAVGVVGTVVGSTAEQQAGDLAQQAAEANVRALSNTLPGLLLPAGQLEEQCRGGDPDCGRFFAQVVGDQPAFLVRVRKDGPSTLLGTRGGFALEPAELLGLARQPAVRSVLGGPGDAAAGGPVEGTTALVRLSTGTGRLALAAVAPTRDRLGTASRTSAVVLGLPVTDVLLQRAVADEDFDVSVVAGDPPRVTATNAPPSSRDSALARVAPLLDGDLGRGRTLAADGALPTLRVAPLLAGPDDQLGVLVVSRSAARTAASQRVLLAALLGSALASVGLVALLAVPLGRRTVDPVRRLTAAAQRLAAGDLSGGGGVVRSRDEVGVLSRTFETMTGALARLTGDLRSSAARLETVLASMSDGLVSTDGDGLVTSVNRAALEMLGVDDAGQLLGRPLAEVVDVRGADDAPLADVGLRVQDAAAEVHRADATTVPVRVSITGLRDGSLEEPGAVLVLRDTTREREVERMKTEFLSNVSHELRTPLTPIRGYADILANRPGLDSDKVARFAGTILAESLKMNRVVDLLVDVASLEAGRVALRPVDVDVRTLLDSRLDAWRAKAPDRADDLRRRVGSGLPPVHVDAEWLGKALDELVDNALKYTTPGTPVTLAAVRAPDGRRVRVAVRDAGPGIAEADQALLFTSFEQVDGSATRRVGGLGLGLSFVRRVADDAGLPLTVSSHVGKGSEFALDLPPGERVPPAREVSPASRAARR
ncbi:MAG: domain S-box, partial [Frankiales bacterium]|nr:domain S-box [Frankiales bacterium]